MLLLLRRAKNQTAKVDLVVVAPVERCLALSRVQVKHSLTVADIFAIWDFISLMMYLCFWGNVDFDLVENRCSWKDVYLWWVKHFLAHRWSDYHIYL